MTKVIFLDIDGPVIPSRAFALPGQTLPFTEFDPCCVGILNRLCDELGYKIVLHTSWIKPRIKGGRGTFDHCVRQGIKMEHFHEDAWCDEYIDWRYTRIHEWLQRHPEVTDYIIFDDEPYNIDRSGVDHGYLADHLYLVDYDIGITPDMYIKIRGHRRLDIKHFKTGE